MDESDYFGILRDHELSAMNDKELEKLLLSKGLFQMVHSVTLSKKPQQIPPPTRPAMPRPTKKLVNAFYGHLLGYYENDINNTFYAFFLDFNEEIFGLKKKQQRGIALKNFKRLSNSVLNTAIKFFHLEKDEGGLEKVHTIQKLEILYGQREAYKHNLASKSALISYLKGESEWALDLFENDKTLDDWLSFEATLKILESLNANYGFETDPDQHEKNLEVEKTSDRDLQDSMQRNPIPPKKASNKKPVLNDSEAIIYLMEHVFGVDDDRDTKQN